MDTRNIPEGTICRPGDRLPVSVRTRGTLQEARQRACTLMASASAGTHGMVHVWAPDRRVLSWEAGAVGGVGVLCLVSCLVGLLELHLFALLLLLFCGLMLMGASWSLWYRPTYVAADDAGIAIASHENGREFCRWIDMEWLRESHSSSDGLILGRIDESEVAIPLNGYPKQARQELINLIVTKGELHPVTKKAGMYAR